MCCLRLARKHRLDAVLAFLDRLDKRRRLDTYFPDFFRHGVAICEPTIAYAYIHLYEIGSVCERAGTGKRIGD